MKKKLVSGILTTVMLLSIFPMGALATDGNTDPSTDGPTDLFIKLFSKVFLGTDTYEVYDSTGNCITEEFVSEYYANYTVSDYQTIWDAVAENSYTLQYGEQKETTARSTSKTVYSPWVYKLEPLEDLMKGKRVEFIYRIAGSYSYSNGQIYAYSVPKVELNMTDPGELFTYTIITNLARGTTNSTKTQITFDLSFSIKFTCPYGIVSPWQTIGPYVSSVVGYV